MGAELGRGGGERVTILSIEQNNSRGEKYELLDLGRRLEPRPPKKKQGEGAEVTGEKSMWYHPVKVWLLCKLFSERVLSVHFFFVYCGRCYGTGNRRR